MKYYNCRKKGHVAKNIWFKKKAAKSNIATLNVERTSNDDWDAKTSFAVEVEEVVLTATIPIQIDYKKDWIVDSDAQIT